MDEPNLSYEPMDIDLSAHSSNKMEISFNESYGEGDEFFRKINDTVKSTPTPVKTEVIHPADYDINPHLTIKKVHIIIPKKKPSARNIAKIKIICTAFVVVLSIIAYQVLNIQCSDGIYLNELRKNLEYKMFGQSKAIDEIIEALSINERSKVIIFYGTTGVGKTFAASTIMELVGQYSNVYHYTMPSFMDTFTTDFMVGLTVCKNSIFIVDDLIPGDLDVKFHIDNLIAKSENLEKDVSILLIYNCDPAKGFKRQCDDFPLKIMVNLKLIKAYKKIIRFETLTEEHLRKCIETELGHKIISDDEFKRISKNFDVTVDGCKGVYMKMKLMGLS